MIELGKHKIPHPGKKRAICDLMSGLIDSKNLPILESDISNKYRLFSCIVYTKNL